MEETKNTCDKLKRHPLTTDETANLARAIVIARTKEMKKE
jgi:hypothetical protein